MIGLGLDLNFGRDNKTDNPNKIEGRVYLTNKSFHSDLDLVSVIERAQFGFLPLSSTLDVLSCTRSSLRSY
ncbi:MAG: hypothetical protein WCF23_16585 [Candidatus Nitrosopolaris sp.]